MQGTPEERFWAKVEITGSCWLWRASNDGHGYGQLSLQRKPIKAHRFAYTLLRGAIPQGLTIDHLCRNRACVNPEHMEVVTQKVNTLRGIGASAKHARATYCLRGHAFVLSNTYRTREGWRCCRLCNRDRNRHRRSAILRGGTLPVRQTSKLTCPKGHPYSGENLYISPIGDHFCRACARQGNRMRKAANRAALLGLPVSKVFCPREALDGS